MARQAEAKGIAALEMTRSVLAALCLLYVMVVTFTVPTQAEADSIQRLRADQLAPIADIVEKAIRDGRTPGAVVLIGNHGEVVYRRAFGFRFLSRSRCR